ncbi:cellulose synthase/poly-beta-1,6-N-acetylglucosamine synthase-like glycosyltransferase [Arthrobacter pigmenti]|uniref:Cellulose synthase/poly-beta-1,6-N-acetylglucosamine synthase-like glycosyltransferase n=1 Tax=Arthrobacter pigmenti TaxID=271432 RepID=A0A846RHL4_9MICC|nr:glycosyltransferase [Arthrobacter pigmenti]NJC22653.1 cellulose synthase/poly-beta-1,6-N-acetylglucosamine synthase-like glycosyltransferase [Arthrobacter pigmenti]
MFVLYTVIVLGLGTLLWTTVGIFRFVAERRRQKHHNANSTEDSGQTVLPEQVAILVAAHNEDAVIAETIASAAALVPLRNIFIVSDGSTDGTVTVARRADVRVLDLSQNRGKAGALLAAIEYFQLAKRFEVVTLLDADTRLAADYLQTGLPPFADPGVVAVAGRVITSPVPSPTRFGRFLIAYRERFYRVVQLLHKYGQAAVAVNVVSIVPGFASMYRSSALKDIDIAAPGLVIEDFNMTFEVHARKLGRIHFHPKTAIAYTQDPDNFRDYTRQIYRWNLGFWQTVRRHGLHRGRFWAALALQIFELISSSLVLLLLVPFMLVWSAFQIAEMYNVESPAADFFSGVFVPEAILLGVLIPDFLLTIFVAAVTRDPLYLIRGLAFPLMRLLDAGIFITALVRAWFVRSTGIWVSPGRRPQTEHVPSTTTTQGIHKDYAV